MAKLINPIRIGAIFLLAGFCLCLGPSVNQNQSASAGEGQTQWMEIGGHYCDNPCCAEVNPLCCPEEECEEAET